MRAMHIEKSLVLATCLMVVCVPMAAGEDGTEDKRFQMNSYSSPTQHLQPTSSYRNTMPNWGRPDPRDYVRGMGYISGLGYLRQEARQSSTAGLVQQLQQYRNQLQQNRGYGMSQRCPSSGTGNPLACQGASSITPLRPTSPRPFSATSIGSMSSIQRTANTIMQRLPAAVEAARQNEQQQFEELDALARANAERLRQLSSPPDYVPDDLPAPDGDLPDATEETMRLDDAETNSIPVSDGGTENAIWNDPNAFTPSERQEAFDQMLEDLPPPYTSSSLRPPGDEGYEGVRDFPATWETVGETKSFRPHTAPLSPAILPILQEAIVQRAK